VWPWCCPTATSLHPAEIAAKVAPGAHAVLLLDQAGWHMPDRLPVPQNLTLAPLPPKCPGLNVMENVLQFMRDNWFSNRVFQLHEAIVAQCCSAWNRLVDQPSAAARAHNLDTRAGPAHGNCSRCRRLAQHGNRDPAQ
jgi:hypothetical protein